MDGCFTFTATNGVVLVSIQGPTCGLDASLNVILPPIIPKGESVLTTIDTDAKTVTYSTSYVSTYALIDANYPAFEKVVPAQVPEREDCLLNLSKLESLIKSAKAYAPKECVFLSPNKKEVNILAIQDHPEWFGILMPMNGQPNVSIPNWLKA
jgi:DNA polymerase III sliding clamp (beta) subunit (PCNA family)